MSIKKSNSNVHLGGAHSVTPEVARLLGSGVSERIRKVISEALEKRVFPGCVVGMVRRDGQRFVLPFGKFTYEQDALAVQGDSIFDVASITKSIPTACLALKLVDEGKLSFDDKLIQYVPEFRNSDRKQVLIRHLLTQTLDFNFRLSSYKDKSPEEILDIIFTSEFRSKPGRRYSYANATSILLGLVIERIENETLDILADKHFFNPLKMGRTTFHPQKFSKQEIAPTEIDPWRGRVIQGEVHDESAYVLSKEKVVGSAGLFSTVPDMLIFLEMLLNKGIYQEKRYLSEEMIERMYKDGLGWELDNPGFMGHFCTKETFGKTGFTGCSVVCDPMKKTGVVILSNYHYPKRKENVDHLNFVRRQIVDTVLL